MPELQAPPVVAVVVTCDPGPWLEDALASLAAQDYPSLSLLVVDNASEEPIVARVASVVPSAYLHRLEENRGFGAGANAVLSLVEHAAFFLFCHDDVVLAPDALRKLVEEAYRSNAGIVAPKYLDPDGTGRILQLGLGMDRFGAPVRRIERGELDQSQHDAVQEVFAAPGGCTLVRGDLFAVLGGFDEAIFMLGEDVDFAWRARLAGARVVVQPAAEVRHVEATSARRRLLPEARALQWRHELRAVLKNYGRARRFSVGARLVLLSVAEIVYFLLRAKTWRAKQVVAAWRWNFAPEQGLKAARAEVAARRRVSDRVVVQLFSRRTSRLARFARVALERRLDDRGRPGGEHHRRRGRRGRPVVIAATVAAVVLVLGARSVLFGPTPLVGQLAPIPAPGMLLGRFFGGWQDAGLQAPGPTSPAFALLGGLAALFSFARGFLLVGGLAACVVAGAFGIARLVRPLGPPGARLIGALAYLAMPLAWNDVAAGDVKALIAYGATPWILLRLARASGTAPFVLARGRVALLLECLALGVLVAIAASFVPALALVTVAIALLLGFGGLLSGTGRGAGRIVIVGIGGTLVAFILCLPWSASFLQPGARWSVVLGAAGRPSAAPSLGSLMRFDLGPMGHSILGLSWFLAAALVLLVGHEERFTWGSRYWAVVLGTLAFCWAADQGWLGEGGGALRLLLAPVAAGLAAAIGLGAASVAGDLRRSRFGWRHVAVLGCGLAGIVGIFPVLAGSLNGRFGQPTTGFDAVLSFRSPDRPAARDATKVLWVGDPTALPLPSWQIRPGLAAAVSLGEPNATRWWLSANPGMANAMIEALQQAQAGRSVRLGAALAAFGVAEIVVPSATAPDLGVMQRATPAPPPSVLLQALGAQTDLHELPRQGSTRVYEVARGVTARRAPEGRGMPGPWRGIALAAEIAAFLAALGVLGATHRRQRRGRAHQPHRLQGTMRLVLAGTANEPAAALDGAVASPPEPAIAAPSGDRPSGRHRFAAEPARPQASGDAEKAPGARGGAATAALRAEGPAERP